MGVFGSRQFANSLNVARNMILRSMAPKAKKISGFIADALPQAQKRAVRSLTKQFIAPPMRRFKRTVASIPGTVISGPAFSPKAGTFLPKTSIRNFTRRATDISRSDPLFNRGTIIRKVPRMDSLSGARNPYSTIPVRSTPLVGYMSPLQNRGKEL